jgi:hypothetical protein
VYRSAFEAVDVVGGAVDSFIFFAILLKNYERIQK